MADFHDIYRRYIYKINPDIALMCVSFQQKVGYQAVLLDDAVSEKDVSDLIDGVKNALSAGIRNLVLVFSENQKAADNGVFTGLLVLCGEMIRREHGRFALIENCTGEESNFQEICGHLNIPVCQSEEEFLAACDLK
jgi:hypothetical protein